MPKFSDMYLPEPKPMKNKGKVAKGSWQDYMKELDVAGVSTPSTYKKRTDKKKAPSEKELYESLGFNKGKITRDTKWDNQYLEPLSKKKYGNSFEKKLNTVFGNEWTARDFERFMTYKDARQTIDSKKAAEATQLWEDSHKKVIKKQQKKAKETQKLVEDISKERDGFLGFLDSTLGRMGDASHKIFGQDFVNAENENYANLAIDKLKKNPKDKHAKQSLQMLNTTARAPKNKLEKASDFIGTAVGELAPYTIGGAYGMADAALGKLGLNAIKNPLAKDLIRGLGAGTIAGTEKAVTRKLASNEQLTPAEYAKRIGTEAALASGGDALLGSVLRNINLKGQIGKLYGETGSKAFNEADFQKALQEAFAPKGNPANVLADAPKVPNIPKPFEKKWNLTAPTRKTLNDVVLSDIPKVENPSVLEDITPKPKGIYDQLQFGQSSKYQPKARPDLSPVERSLDPMNRPQSYWKDRYENFVDEVKQTHDMNQMTPEALDDLWSQYAKYDEPVSLGDAVDLAYGKGPQSKLFTDPGFDPVKRLEELYTPKPNLKTALQSDPKIAEALKQFDALAPGSRNPKYSMNGNYGEAPVEDVMNLLGGNKKVLDVPINQKQSTDYLLNQLKLKGSTPKGNSPGGGGESKKLTMDEFNQLVSGKNNPIKETTKTTKKVRPAVKAIAESKEPVAALKTVKTKKDINTMSKDELQAIQNDLYKKRQKSLKAKDYKKAKQIKEDLDKVDGLLLKLDLQLFGKEAEKAATEAVNEPIVTENPAPKTEADNEFKDIKDINQFQVGTKNIYEIADRLPQGMGNNIRKSLDTAKVNYVSQLEKETNALYDNVVKELGIKAGSKESALVQDFGEKTLGKEALRKQGIDPNEVTTEELELANLEALKEKTPKWGNIVKADEYFRTTYDRLIDEVNAVRKQIYPTDPEKIVPKRNDYYHHFNELEGFEGFKNLFDTPANIDPHLEGVSPYTKPKTKFQGFMQKRGLGPYKSDAVGGMLKYIKASSHSINVDPVIPTLRKTANTLADATEGSKNANKIIEALNDHANDLAGKTNPYDRVTQKLLSRRGMRLVNWVNGRVKSNMILGNFGSLVGQAGSVPLGIGKAKLHAIPGLKNTVEQSVKELFHAEKTAPIYKSNFLKERYADGLFRRFDHKLIQQPKRMAVWAMETADKANTRFIWNSMYAKGLKEAAKKEIQNASKYALKYADYETRKIVAGRGVGEVPLLQKSRTMQVFAPFTLEVGNQWKVLREMVGDKDAAGLITAMVAAYGLNKAAEQVRGMNIAFDPIDAIIDGYTKNDGTKGQKALNALGSLTGEVVGNIPGGNLLTQFANTEKKVPFTDLQFKEVFGERDPNRFGTGITMAKAFEDPSYLLMPFGASQFRKTTRGIDASLSGAVYKGDNGTVPFGGPKEELMYPMKNNAWDSLKLPIMGTSSTSSAKEYYDNERKPLNENQTKAYKLLEQEGLGNELYDILRTQNTKASVKAKFTKIAKDPDLSSEEKIAALEELLAQIRGGK